MRYLISWAFILMQLLASGASAQPKHCAHTEMQGDTLICQSLYADSTLKQEDFYVRNKRIFSRFWYYWNSGYGWLQQKGKEQFGEKEGPARSYYPDGSILSVQTYHDDHPVGECLHYYHSGMLQMRCHHAENGKIDGIRLTFYENGRVQSKTRWINGHMREILRYKDEAGNDLEIGTFKWGNGDWTWYEHGKPAYRYKFKNGIQVKTVALQGGEEESPVREPETPDQTWRLATGTGNAPGADTIRLINPSFELDEALPGTTPTGWINLGLETESPPDIQPGNFEVKLPAQDGKRYVGLVVRESNTWEGIGQRLSGFLKKDSAYTFSLYLTRSQKYVSATKMSPEPINLNAPTILKIWGFNTATQQEELLAQTSAVSHSEWIRYSFTLKPTVADFNELDLMAYYAPGFEQKNGNLLIDNCSPIVKAPK